MLLAARCALGFMNAHEIKATTEPEEEDHKDKGDERSNHENYRTLTTCISHEVNKQLCKQTEIAINEIFPRFFSEINQTSLNNSFDLSIKRSAIFEDDNEPNIKKWGQKDTSTDAECIFIPFDGIMYQVLSDKEKQKFENPFLEKRKEWLLYQDLKNFTGTDIEVIKIA